MYNDIVIEPLGNNLLYEFTHTLKEADQPICLCQAVVRVAGLVEDDNGAFVPGVGAAVEGGVKDVGEGIRSGGVGLGEDAVSNSARARRHGGSCGLEGWVVNQGAIGGLEGWEGFDLSSIAGLGEAPDVTVFDGVVESLVRPRV